MIAWALCAREFRTSAETSASWELGSQRWRLLVCLAPAEFGNPLSLGELLVPDRLH